MTFDITENNIENSPHVLHIDQKDSDGNTPLMIASDGGFEEIVNILLDAGADRHQVNNNDENALMIACKNGYLDVVRELLKEESENELSLNRSDKNGHSALALAVMNKHDNVVNYIVDNFSNLLSDSVISDASQIARENDFQNLMEIL